LPCSSFRESGNLVFFAFGAQVSKKTRFPLSRE
jgi:hypothetical protein